MSQFELFRNAKVKPTRVQLPGHVGGLFDGIIGVLGFNCLGMRRLQIILVIKICSPMHQRLPIFRYESWPAVSTGDFHPSLAQWEDKPRTADYAIQVLSTVLSHAVDPLGKIAGNPQVASEHRTPPPFPRAF